MPGQKAGMAELLGILLALLLAGLAWLLVRLLRRVREWLAGWRPPPGRLKVARALGRSQAARIAALTAELERSRLALRLAERELARLRAGRPGPDDRFLRAKRAFALRFHPDRVWASGTERALRRAIFQEFWAELRRIERE